MERMFALLEENAEIQDAPGALPLRRRAAPQCASSTSISPTSRTAQILFDVTFEIPAGHTVAVVGPSGAGKSTLSRLLFRFYDVSGGRITIDGQDIRDVTQTSLRAAIGIVPQDTVLFNDTHLLQHRVWPPGRDARGDRRRGAARAYPRFHREPAQGYDTHGGRARA